MNGCPRRSVRRGPAGWVLAVAAVSGAGMIQAGGTAVAAPPRPGATLTSLPQAAVAILNRRCFSCHGQIRMKGLDLRTRQAAMKGGGHGPALVPGRPNDSALIRMVTGAKEPRMPPGVPLPAAEIETLRRWVASGAVYPGQVAAPAWSPYKIGKAHV